MPNRFWAALTWSPPRQCRFPHQAKVFKTRAGLLCSSSIDHTFLITDLAIRKLSIRLSPCPEFPGADPASGSGVPGSAEIAHEALLDAFPAQRFARAGNS